MADAVEGNDGTFAVGINPVFGYDREGSQWRRMCVDSLGRIITSPADTSSSVFEPTVAGVTLRTGAGEVLGVTNTTASILTLYDDTTPILLVLPAASIVAPVSFATSLIVKSASAALTKQASVIWKEL